MDEKIQELIKEMPIFQGMQRAHIQTMLDCFSAEVITFQKNQQVFSTKKTVGCLLKGEICGVKKGELFPMPKEEAPLNANQVSLVLTLDSHMLLYPCYGCCFFHSQLLENMKELGLNLHTLERK